ncbi:thioredoxin domain-containing protein [Stenotrophomonas sp. SY1]|uniref:DsbA family protein n=1 Tax=Stenotrophomonas sp. SY1 TaxID=477235 RepID=UPI001E4A3DAB|nr:thioredoxin domain-containing protein [Stenotrophomonas sp. SY1]MCD9086890.1 DsbA family protein [Stenotrophomonas sp. SY1]
MSVLSVPVGNQDHIQGRLDAPVVLVEYADYQCPYCEEAFSLIKRLQQRFGDTLCVVFRNFPLPRSHPQALPAAITAEYAATHGQFWPAHDALFRSQQQLGEVVYRELMRELGLPEEGLAKAMDDPVYLQRIQRDAEGGFRSGVTGTPTIFVNERIFTPNESLEELYDVILAASGQGR